MTIADASAHQALYAKIPKFECKKGCTDCCGVIVTTPWERDRMGEPPAGPARAAGSLRCPYATDRGCSVYDRRPLLCRMFGAVDHPKMTCPHGCRPLVTLTDQEGDQIMGVYNNLLRS
jgi:hypothetical protein